MPFSSSLVGADRTGIVGPLGTIITDHGGNVGRSKMIVLGSQFCLMVEISLDKLVHKATAITSQLSACRWLVADFCCDTSDFLDMAT